MSTTDAASRTLAAASQRIDQLAEAAEEHHGRVAQIRRDPDLSPEYRDRLLAEERQRFDAVHRQSILDARRDMKQAATLAAQRLASAGTPDPRASQRVSRLLDGGIPPLAAAEVLAEAGDLAALRELRDQLPSLVVLTLPASEQRRRPQVIEEALLAVDRRMAPLLTGDDGAAVEVRLGLDREEARLTATSEFAFNPTPGALFKLGLANRPDPELPTAAHAS